jgi:predicted permease
VQALPGVDDAGLGETIPLGGSGESTGLRIPDIVRGPDVRPPFANYTIASPGYLHALGVPIRSGRDFLKTDGAGSLPVTIVNEAFARQYWPGQDPIGKQVGVPIDAHDMTVIGVAADVKHVSMRETVSPEIYVPFTQKPWPSMQTMHVAVRTKAAPLGMTAAIREAVRALDAEVPIARVTTLSTIVDESLAQPRLAMLLVSAFGGLSLLLAGVGLYGAVAYTVAGRTAEIGIRVALGAAPRRILAIAIGPYLRLTVLGIAAGTLLALGGLRVISRFLYGVEATDPVTLAGVALLLVAVSLLACYVPARRAMKVDPLLAIRTE